MKTKTTEDLGHHLRIARASRPGSERYACAMANAFILHHMIELEEDAALTKKAKPQRYDAPEVTGVAVHIIRGTGGARGWPKGKKRK